MADQADSLTLVNGLGTTVTISNYGATILAIFAVDRLGEMGDIVLGYPHLADYGTAENQFYTGSIVGRYANRLANGRFSIAGKQ